MNETKLKMPILLPNEEVAATRSDINWLARPGQRFYPGQPLAYCRAYHPELRTRWWSSQNETQVILSVPDYGTMAEIPREEGGWNAIASSYDWNAATDTEATFVSESGKSTQEADCTIVYADRFHQFLERRGGGILTAPLERLDVWSHAPKRPKVKMLGFGVCDLVSFFGGITGDYHRWTRRFAVPSITSFVPDLFLAYSSHYLKAELTCTDDEWEEVCADVADLISTYMEQMGGNADTQSGMFLMMLLKFLRMRAMASELKEARVPAAQVADDAQRFAFLALNTDSVVHLRSKRSKLVFSIALFRFEAFDKPLIKLLRKRFRFERPNPQTTIDNYREIISVLDSHGYKSILSLLSLPKERLFRAKALSLSMDYLMRQINAEARQLAAELGAGIFDSNQIIAKHGVDSLVDREAGNVAHYNNELIEEMRDAIVQCMVEQGMPAEYLAPTDIRNCNEMV